VKGVKLTVQGQASSASLVFLEIAPDIFIPSVGPGAGGDDVKDSDTEALAAGFITVTPIDNDKTASSKRNKLNSVINAID